MRFCCTLAALLLCTTLQGETLAPGTVVETPIFKGIILNPSTMKTPDYTDRKVTYWTPSRELILKAEKALAVWQETIKSTTPPGGFHSHDYYTPKYYSRDRVISTPDIAYTEQYNLILDYADHAEPSTPREYIGVTVDGHKKLSMSFMTKYGGGLYYDVETGTFEVYIFGEIEDR